jgi:Holliday junction resolvasome RuvABC endonuclease subunit
MTTVLGIDISSTTIGWCVLDIDGYGKIQFKKCDYLKPKKDGTIIERIVDTRNKVSQIIKDVKPDYIGIEDIRIFNDVETNETIPCFLPRNY